MRQAIRRPSGGIEADLKTPSRSGVRVPGKAQTPPYGEVVAAEPSSSNARDAEWYSLTQYRALPCAQ